METIIRGAEQEVIISFLRPTVIIGERINPTGRKKLVQALKAGQIETVVNEAKAQIAAGADVVDVNVVTPGVDEVEVLPIVVESLVEAVGVPLSIDFHDPRALEKALKVYQYKPLVNSVTGEAKSLDTILPLVKEKGAAVIGLTIDEKGIPRNTSKRLEIAEKIIDKAESFGIPQEDIIIDCLALTVGADSQSALVTLDAIRKVRAQLGVNQTLGVSNISYGLPDRHFVNWSFLPLAIEAGVTCPTLDVSKARQIVLGTDLLLGRDRFAQRYISNYTQGKEFPK